MDSYYDDGQITIYHGDCRDILPSLPTADLLLTDPPYGIQYRSGKRKTQWDHLFGDVDSSVTKQLLLHAVSRLRLNRHAYIFGPWDAADFPFSASIELVWDKGGMGSGNLGLPWGLAHERILFGVHHGAPSMQGSGALAARLRKSSVLRVPRQNNGNGATSHPTEKPVQLLRILIESSSTFDELVLDPFAGSGSTLEAARLEGRRAIGIEIEERYCEVAAKRFAQGVLDLGGAA